VDFTVIVSGPTTTVDQEGYFSRLTGDDGDGTRMPWPEIRERMKNYVATGFDPMPYLRAQRASGLWIYGGKDESVPVEMSIENLKLLQKEGKPFEIVTFPKGQHVMWETEDGSRQFMPLITRYVPGYYEAMVRWILQHVRPRISRHGCSRHEVPVRTAFFSSSSCP
jgi:pimeloyl-ACP methyl ester carboxylesterase